MDSNRKLVHSNGTNDKASRKQKIALLKSVAAGKQLTPARVEEIYGRQPDLILHKNEIPTMTIEELHVYLDNQTKERRDWAENIRFEEQKDGSCFVWYPKPFPS